jgi:ferredoxin--NADP+ reductase
LYFFSTGTGFAPFASLLREPETYENYDEVIVTHTCRDVAELTYGRELIENIKSDEMMIELLGEENLNKIRYYPTTTREQSPKMGRITKLIEKGELFSALGVPALDPATDRAMVCGSLAFNLDIKALMEKAGLNEGANSEPGQFVIEKAFVG